MTAHDTQGVQVLDACRRAGIRVLDEVAVLRVDNDPVACGLAKPSLSSLDQNARPLGFEAAALLACLMRGKRMEASNYFFEPGEVVTRQSLDVLAIKDPNVAKAIRFIHENACREIDGAAIAREAGQSRRAGKKYRALAGRTPMKVVHAIRLRRIKQLLTNADFVLSDVAARCGCAYQEYMSRFFNKHTAMTPGGVPEEVREVSVGG